MQISTFKVSNFRRLKDVRIDLEADTSIFVGANNSGKTSATHVFKLFLGSDSAKGKFTIHDFSADCWREFDAAGGLLDPEKEVCLPTITLDIWLKVEEENAHRVIDLLPSLDWAGDLVGVRLSYQPRSVRSLLDNYRRARAHAESKTKPDNAYRPWPESLSDYLSKRLRDEYQIEYGGLDAQQAGEGYSFDDAYEPFQLASNRPASARIVESLIRVDFLDAQRYLSDSDSKGRAEDLSKRLSRYYARHLKKPSEDFKALGAITESEAGINAHYAEEFSPLLDRISEIGYPGVANPKLLIKTSLDAESLLAGNARVHYAMPAMDDDGSIERTLPDQYNGLGFKNLIYMVVEVLDFDSAWMAADEERPPVHLVIIEEPESHLHAQLQQVFIRKIRDIIPKIDGFQTQMIVTTHSAHVIYESEFNPIRYFKRTSSTHAPPHTEVKNLSIFYDTEEKTRDFLLQYFKLTHCDLFFADAAVFIEGNVERLLVPLMIKKVAPALQACHLTLLEVGGAFAHVFKTLIEFLDVPTLIITDLDSVWPPTDDQMLEEPEDLDESNESEETTSQSGLACPADKADAVTSNQTLIKWAPRLKLVSALLSADATMKVPVTPSGRPGRVRVAYQTAQSCVWKTDSETVAGRTLEEAFALQNLEWCQHEDRKDLRLRVVTKKGSEDLTRIREKLFKRVRAFDKTAFALALIAEKESGWQVPEYIKEGLVWLMAELKIEEALPVDEPAVELPLEREVASV